MKKTAIKLVTPAKPAASVMSVRDILGDKYTPAMAEAFPDVEPGIMPFGYLIMLQIRTPRNMAGKLGLIHKIDDTKDAEKWRVQTGLVRSMGPSSFKRRDTLEAWPEGNWCNPGDFVRCPMWGGDRWEVPVPGGKPDDRAIFMIVKDTDLIGVVTTDPANIITS